MYRKIIVGLMLVMFLSCPVLAYNTIITPLTVDIQLVGGDIVSRDIQIISEEDQKLEIYITTEIYPDGEGINVGYSVDSPFILESYEDLVITMVINTSMFLMPQNYTIETIFEIEGEKPVKKSSTKIFYTGVTPEGDDDDYVPPHEKNDDTDDDTDDKPLPGYIKPKTEINHYLFWGLLFIILVIVITILYFMQKRKGTKRK